MQMFQSGPYSLSYYNKIHKQQDKQQDLQRPQCRICLQQMVEEPQLQYCQCRGNLKYVHQECLLQWTKWTKIHSQGKIKYCFCQICRGRILLQTQTNLTCFSLSQICDSIFCNPVMSQRIKRILLVLFLVLLISAQIILVAIYIAQKEEKRGTRILIALISVNSFFLVLGSLYFLFKYLLTYKIKVKAIKGVAINQLSLEKMAINNGLNDK